MRQVIQNLRSGKTSLEDVPAPRAAPGSLLIRTKTTLISAGTERMLVDFGRASLLDKARQHPDKVRMVLDKIRTDGLGSTLEAVRSKLDAPLPLGYCNVGSVIDVGSGCHGFQVGDRVVSNGGHAEIVVVPINLCAKVPSGVSDDEAVFAVIGAIALQGMRLAQPTLGECFAVIGLGLIGLLTVQLLRAHGCRVLAIDPDASRVEMARAFGAEPVQVSSGADPLLAAERFSRGAGLDAVLITAATTSNEPVSQAAQMCRKRGRIVLVGVTGLELDRAQFYEKELSFQVSCSYGPGRYDPNYEQKGQDYPIGFVRWTENRNFEAVIDTLEAGKLDVRPLITHRYAFGDAARAYDLLVSGSEPVLGILLEYPSSASEATKVEIHRSTPVDASGATGDIGIGVIGAGNYCGRTLLPALPRANLRRVSIASSGGVTASHYARRFGFLEATTDASASIADSRVNTVLVATRHDSHARFACEALRAGKHVFVEKPLALTEAELDAIRAAAETSDRILCVGFNRRFAPLTQHAKRLVDQRNGPLVVNITVNAGRLPAGHWTKDVALGGGRILGEGVHFIDLARFFAASPIADLQVVSAASPDTGRQEDISAVQMSFANGSIASIQYLANGHSSYPKERIELFWDSKSLTIDNFKRTIGWGVAGVTAKILGRQDKGHAALLAAFFAAIRGTAAPPIPAEELFEVAHWSICAGSLASTRAAPPTGQGG
jgi:predicted dehydrogenase